MSDWHDRAIDGALQELHGAKPPDLSARVLLALHERPAEPLPRVEPGPQPVGRGLPWAQFAAILCAAVLLGFGAAWTAVWLLRPESPAGAAVAVASAPTIELGVLAGEVSWIASDPDQPLLARADDIATIQPIRGARIRCRLPTAFRLGTFGLLLATAHSELELEDMSMDRKHGVVAISSLTLGVAAGAFSWHVLTRTETANVGDRIALRAGAELDPRAALVATNRELLARIEGLERENQRLQVAATERQAVAAQVAATEPAAAAPPEAPPVAAMVFSDPRFAALAKVDWAKMGAVSNEMGPLLVQFVEAMEKEGAELPMELAVKLQQLNSKLVEQVPALLEAGVPGFDANGAYTHPLVVANTLASTLGVAGQSLTSAQQNQVDGLVRSFSAEAQAIADSPHDLVIEQLLAETEMKDRFFREVGTALTPEQAKVLYPGGASEYDGASLFDSGVNMRAHAHPVEAKDAADFARVVSQDVGRQLGLDDAQAERLQAIVRQAAASPELWAQPATAAERSQGHFLRSERTRAALRQQAAWMRRFQQEAGLTPEQAKKFGRMGRVLVPLPR